MNYRDLLGTNVVSAYLYRKYGSFRESYYRTVNVLSIIYDY